MLRQCVAEGAGPPGHIALGRVGEHVHSRVRGHRGGHPGQKGGVQHCRVGEECVIHQGILHTLLLVGEHGKGSDLRPGPRRGGHRPEGQFRPGGKIPHCLGAVQGRAAGRKPPWPPAAHSLGCAPPGPPAPGRVPGITWSNTSTVQPLQRPFELVQQSGLGQKAVGDHQHPLPRQRLQGPSASEPK